MIGSPRVYLSSNRRAITRVSNYRCPIWTFCNGMPVTGYPRDLHVNYVWFNGFSSQVSRSFQHLWKALQMFSLKRTFRRIRLTSNWTSCRTIQGVTVLIISLALRARSILKLLAWLLLELYSTRSNYYYLSEENRHYRILHIKAAFYSILVRLKNRALSLKIIY